MEGHSAATDRSGSAPPRAPPRPRRRARGSRAADQLAPARPGQRHGDVGDDRGRARRQNTSTRSARRTASATEWVTSSVVVPVASHSRGQVLVRAARGSARRRRRTARRGAAGAAAWRGSGRWRRAAACRRTVRAGRAVLEALEADERDQPVDRRGDRRACAPASAPARRCRARCATAAATASWKAIGEPGRAAVTSAGVCAADRRPCRPSAPRARRQAAAASTCRSPTGRPAPWSARPRRSGRGRQRLDARRAAAERLGEPPAARPRAADLRRVQPPWTSSRIDRSHRSGVTVRPSSASVRMLAATVSSVNQPKPWAVGQVGEHQRHLPLGLQLLGREVEAGVGEHLDRQRGRRGAGRRGSRPSPGPRPSAARPVPRGGWRGCRRWRCRSANGSRSRSRPSASSRSRCPASPSPPAGRSPSRAGSRPGRRPEGRRRTGSARPRWRSMSTSLSVQSAWSTGVLASAMPMRLPAGPRACSPGCSAARR